MRLCFWCEKELPKKGFIEREQMVFCGQGCCDDYQISSYPKWMTGRIGLEPTQKWHMTYNLLCLSAPNKYRAVFRKHGEFPEIQSQIIEMQRKEYPHLKGPIGLQIDYPTWDQVIAWENSTLKDVI